VTKVASTVFLTCEEGAVQEQTRADKSRQEQTRADKSRQEQEQTRADKSRQDLREGPVLRVWHRECDGLWWQRVINMVSNSNGYCVKE
jgi:hypothetical protein